MGLSELTPVNNLEILPVPEIPKLCETFQGEKGKINIGDCSLYAESELGTGTGNDKYPLVLLHGGPGGTHHDFHPYFSRAKTAFQSVNYYDQRGCGESDYNPGSGYSIDQAVEDLEKLRQAKGFGKMVVLGHSYGGILAQAYALKYPDSLAGLVLVTSGLGFPDKQIDASIDKRGIARMTHEEQLACQNLFERFGRNEINEPTYIYNKLRHGDWKIQLEIQPTPEQMAYAAKYEWVHDPMFRAAIGQSIKKVDLRGKFAEFAVPTLIVEGDDPTWEESKPIVLKSNHPNAELIVIPDTGHIPFRDKPNEFFGKIEDFMKRKIP